MGLFDRIDFEHLPDGFNEDAVREEIITPLLNLLGYSTFDSDRQIVRAPRLRHPYAQFGSNRENLSLVPDYLIRVNQKNAFVLEAKSPSQNILSGRNVEQAYSYASHHEIKASIFVLCNGKELTIFSTPERSLLLHIKFMGDIEQWDKLFDLLNPIAFINPHIKNYLMDYGIYCIENGLTPGVTQYFYNARIGSIDKIDDDTYTFASIIVRDGRKYYASFDFGIGLFENFLSHIPFEIRESVKIRLKTNPFKYDIDSDEQSFPLSFSAKLSGRIFKNMNETYCPFMITSFLDE